MEGLEERDWRLEEQMELEVPRSHPEVFGTCGCGLTGGRGGWRSGGVAVPVAAPLFSGQERYSYMF